MIKELTFMARFSMHKLLFLNMFLKAFFILVFTCTAFIPATAQLNNQAFLSKDTIQATHLHALSLAVNNLNFFKNNEYFNDIVPGYTLFGYQLNPQLTYQPAKNLKISAGVFLWKDFGNHAYSRITPTFTVKWQADSLAVIFGTLEGNVNHQLIEPLFDFERIINNRLENGLQLLYHKNRIRADLWIDWQQMIYKDSPFQEEISTGFSSAYVLTRKKNYSIEIPLQLQIFHRGGQIGTQVYPLTNWFNGAAGISAQYHTGPDARIRSLRMDNYMVFYQDFSSRKVNIFSNGSALYLNFSLRAKWLEFMASYWLANQFRSFQGGNVYQSVAVFPLRAELPDTLSQPGNASPRFTGSQQPPEQKVPYREKDRELLIFRFMRDFKIIDGLTLTLRFEPIYNLPKQTLEFSHGFYINYRQNFLLKKITPQ